MVLKVDTYRAKAFDFAQETVKQLIALATGIVALTITFLKDLASTAPQDARDTLTFAWIAYFVSVVAGCVALQTLTGNLERPKVPNNPSIYASNITIPMAVQLVAFGAGLALTILFGLRTRP